MRSRVALYSSYCSCRKVGPGGSKATAIASGDSCSRMRRSVIVKP